jgi:hypothetical protein
MSTLSPEQTKRRILRLQEVINHQALGRDNDSTRSSPSKRRGRSNTATYR